MHIKQILLVSLLITTVLGELSLTHTALVQERKLYQASVDNAVQAALKQLTREHEITSTATARKIYNLDEAQVAESLLYSLTMEMDIGMTHGQNYAFKFAQPLTAWRSLHAPSTLPDTPRSSSSGLTLHGSVPSYISPEISLTLSGPMELYFPHATTELEVKTPRFVDVGFVDRIILKEGANITLTGSAELRLRESISIEPFISEEQDLLLIDTSDRPKLNVYGHHIEIKNAEGEQIKVHKKYSSVLEVTSQGNTVVKSGHLPFQFPLNDSRIATIKTVLQQISMQSGSSYLPSVHKLASGSSVEAVVSFLIPLEIEDEAAGRTMKYDLVVAQGSNHKEAQVISIEKQKVHNQVTFSEEIHHNGTLPDAFDRLHRYLQTNNRMM